MEKLTLAVHCVRDLIAWRVQLRAPLNNRDAFLEVAQRAWLATGTILNEHNLSKLLHAHQQKVAPQLSESFLTQTKHVAQRHGGKVRAKRDRVKIMTKMQRLWSDLVVSLLCSTSGAIMYIV